MLLLLSHFVLQLLSIILTFCFYIYYRYSVEGFLDKNKDLLFQDFKRLMYNRCQTSWCSWQFSNWVKCINEFHAHHSSASPVTDTLSSLSAPLFLLPSLSHSANPVLKEMWPDGQLSITEVTKRPLTAATLFKNSIVALVDKLSCKVSGFSLKMSSCSFPVNPWRKLWLAFAVFRQIKDTQFWHIWSKAKQRCKGREQ